MGRRGPKREPDEIKDQKSPVRSKQRRRIFASLADAAPGSIEPPPWLKADGGRNIWNRLAPTLRTAKLLTEADVPAFARYCRHYARWLDLQKRLDQGGDIYEIETASGLVRRADPAFLMADRLDRMLLALEDRFGLNPAERQRIFVARSQTGVTGDLFSQFKDEKRQGDPAAQATSAAEPEESPIGLLN